VIGCVGPCVDGLVMGPGLLLALFFGEGGSMPGTMLYFFPGSVVTDPTPLPVVDVPSFNPFIRDPYAMISPMKP
jgi:hypothetical protein